MMPDKQKNQRKESFPYAEADESHNCNVLEISLSVVQELLKARECVMKLSMESIVASV